MLKRNIIRLMSGMPKVFVEHRKPFRLFCLPIIIILGLFLFCFPIVMALWVFLHWAGRGNPFFGNVHFVGLENYRQYGHAGTLLRAISERL